MSENVIKFTEPEMQAIAQLQAKYQQKIFDLGQLELGKIEVEQELAEIASSRTKLLDDWKKIQAEEHGLLQQLAQKYGDGSLSLKDGTFKPAPKK